MDKSLDCVAWKRQAQLFDFSLYFNYLARYHDMDRKGNILMVANYPSDTAYAWWLMEQFWKTIAGLINKQGQDAYVCYPRITTLSETITNSNIKTVELVVPWKTPEQQKIFEQFVKDNNISYVYFTDQSYFNPKYFAMRRYGIRKIINHDHTPGDRPPVRGIKGLLKAIRNKLPMVCADKVFCVSELMRTRSIENERIPATKCIVVQNGINPVNCQQNRADVRDALGVNRDTVLIVTSGRAHPYKRFDFIIQAAHDLKTRKPDLDFAFLIAGDGPAMNQLEEMIKKLGLESCVKLLGFRKDVHDILCASDIAVHAALGEGFSLSILEYMSAGLPVVAPDIPSVSQALAHDETGFIYEWQKPESAAQFIEQLVNESEKRKTMGSKARQVANSQYSFDNCLSRLADAAIDGYGLANQ